MKRHELTVLLDSLNIKLSKARSQHFLVDENILKEQVRLANIRDRDVVLEIGTGLGSLTSVLADSAKKVITVENDKRFIDYLEKNLPSNVELIHDDILSIDLPEFDKVVANIPYEISSKIVFKLLGYRFIAAVMIFQWEFAKRMVARCGSGDYSRLAVKIYSKAHCEILGKVSRNAFFPVPGVDSGMIELVPREPNFNINNEQIFNHVVDAVFNQKRKMIKNSLLNKHHWFKMNKDDFKKILDKIENLDRRGEELEVEELAELANDLELKLKN